MIKNDNIVFPKTGTTIAILSLFLAVLALIASPAFSGAIIVSMFAFVGSLMGALSGWNRLAILTIYAVIITFVINPISSWLAYYVGFKLIMLFAVTIGFLLIVGLIINYKYSK